LLGEGFEELGVAVALIYGGVGGEEVEVVFAFLLHHVVSI
jgi:hypothetical protein